MEAIASPLVGWRPLLLLTSFLFVSFIKPPHAVKTHGCPVANCLRLDPASSPCRPPQPFPQWLHGQAFVNCGTINRLAQQKIPDDCSGGTAQTQLGKVTLCCSMIPLPIKHLHEAMPGPRPAQRRRSPSEPSVFLHSKNFSNLEVMGSTGFPEDRHEHDLTYTVHTVDHTILYDQ